MITVKKQKSLFKSLILNSFQQASKSNKDDSFLYQLLESHERKKNNKKKIHYIYNFPLIKFGLNEGVLQS